MWPQVGELEARIRKYEVRLEALEEHHDHVGRRVSAHTVLVSHLLTMHSVQIDQCGDLTVDAIEKAEMAERELEAQIEQVVCRASRISDLDLINSIATVDGGD